MENESSWNLFENTWNTSTGDNSQNSILTGLPLGQDYEQPTQSIVITTSASFFPGAQGTEANLILCSSDWVCFYVHSDVLSSASENAFREILATTPRFNDNQDASPRLVPVPETSHILDVILRFLHNLAFSGEVPTFQIFVDAIAAMPRYDINPATLLVPSNPCYNHILTFAPAYPLEVYSLAANLDIYHLAVTASSHLLSQSLFGISDEMAIKMGALYLKRFYNLHHHRLEMLKSIMTQPPHPHPSTKSCDFIQQKQLTRAWIMTAAYFIWDATSKCDLSAKAIQSSFDNLKGYVDCKDCQEMLEKRVKDVISRWVVVRRTI